MTWAAHKEIVNGQPIGWVVKDGETYYEKDGETYIALERQAAQDMADWLNAGGGHGSG